MSIQYLAKIGFFKGWLFNHEFHYRIALTGNVESWLPTCGRNLCRNSVGYHLTHHVANHDARVGCATKRAVCVGEFVGCHRCHTAAVFCSEVDVVEKSLGGSVRLTYKLDLIDVVKTDAVE